jgi:tetratricopeptide (TPR) repeat protein
MNRSIERAALVAVMCLAFNGATTTSARAQTPNDDRARTHFQSGRLYFAEGAYERALQEFENAYRLSPRPVMLLNLANTNERLGRPGAAAAHLRTYLEQTPDAPDRDTILRRIENLSAQQAQMDAAEAERQRLLEEERARLAAQHGRTTPAEEEDSGPRRNLTVPLIAFGAGGAGLITFAVVGAMANGKESDLASGCGATRTCTASEVAPADRLALIADIGLGIGIAGVAAGTVLLFVGPGARPDDESTAPTVSVAPMINRSTAGFAAEVRF